MTPEARLDRLERIAKLFVKAGLRQRRESKDQGSKINHLINLQIHNEKFADQKGKIGGLIDLQIHNDERFVNQGGKIDNLIELQEQNEVRFAKLAESQARTDRSLAELIKISKRGRNGNSQTDS